MHPNGAPSTDANGMSDADHLANGRETQNITGAWSPGAYGGLADADNESDSDSVYDPGSYTSDEFGG